MRIGVLGVDREELVVLILEQDAEVVALAPSLLLTNYFNNLVYCWVGLLFYIDQILRIVRSRTYVTSVVKRKRKRSSHAYLPGRSVEPSAVSPRRRGLVNILLNPYPYHLLSLSNCRCRDSESVIF